MRIFWIFLYLIFAQTIFAQQSFVVVDSESRQPLPFATIRQEDAGVYSDANGRVATTSLIAGGLLEISMMGYEAQSFKLETVADTIFLKPAAINLPEVVVTSAKREMIEVTPLKSTGMFGTWPLAPANEIFIAISSEFEEKQLMGLNIPFSKSNEKKRRNVEGAAMIRVNIYVGIEAGTENRIYASAPVPINKIGKDFVEINLETYGIYLGQQRLCIGIEMLGYVNSDGSLTEDESYVRLRLTGKQLKNFSTTTFLRKTLNLDGPVPITTILNKEHWPGMIVPERNLSIGMVLR